MLNKKRSQVGTSEGGPGWQQVLVNSWNGLGGFSKRQELLCQTVQLSSTICGFVQVLAHCAMSRDVHDCLTNKYRVFHKHVNGKVGLGLLSSPIECNMAHPVSCLHSNSAA